MRLNMTIHAYPTTLDEQLRVPTGGGGAGDFQEGSQSQRPLDGDVLHDDTGIVVVERRQLLRRIGMIK